MLRGAREVDHSLLDQYQPVKKNSGTVYWLKTDGTLDLFGSQIDRSGTWTRSLWWYEIDEALNLTMAIRPTRKVRSVTITPLLL